MLVISVLLSLGGRNLAGVILRLIIAGITAIWTLVYPNTMRVNNFPISGLWMSEYFISTLATHASPQKVDPNDHVNMGQSGNDVIPTAINVITAMASK